MHTSDKQNSLLRLAYILGNTLCCTKWEQQTAKTLEDKYLGTTKEIGSYVEFTISRDGREYVEAGKAKPSKAKAAPVRPTQKSPRLVSEPTVQPQQKRPCLVNVITGERTYGRPGEDEESLFERLYS